MGNDEQEAIHVLTEAMSNENLDAAVRVNAAAALVLWSALESIAKNFDSER